MANRLTLITAETTDGNKTAIINDLSNDEQDLEVVGTGTFTLQLEILASDGTTYIPTRDLSRNVVSVTANEILPLSIPYNKTVRAVLSGTSSASVSAWLVQREKRGR